MWLDDDGEDDPTPGPVPDPSERQWRHPSEIAAELAAASADSSASDLVDVSPVATSRRTPGESILWPIAVVGGSIAIAAFGVLGLTTLGPTGTSGLRVGGTAMTSVDGALAPAVPNAGSGPQPTIGTLDSSTGPASDPVTKLVDDDEPGDVSTTIEFAVPPNRAGAASSTSLIHRLDQDAGETGRELWASSTEPLSTFDGLLGRFAVYATDDLDGRPLASLLAIGEHLLSSAGAIGERDSFFVRVGEEFYPATVTGRDWHHDVALIEVLDDSGLELPDADFGQRPLAEISVTIGYCLPDGPAVDTSLDRPLWCDPGNGATAEVRPEQHSTPTPPSESGDAKTDTDEDPDTDADTDTDTDADERGAGLGDETGRSADANGSPQAEPDDETDQSPDGLAGKPADDLEPDGDVPVDQTDTADQGAVEQGAVEQSTVGSKGGIILRGRAFTPQAGDEAADQTTDRLRYAAIKTHIRRTTAMSGAPLRDELGRILGMVTSGSGQYVSAVPIEQVLSATASLLGAGGAESVWIGIDLVPVSEGLRVASIDDDSPFSGVLDAGDVLTAANGEPLLDRQQLIAILRRIGVGQVFSADYIGQDGPSIAQVLIMAAPAQD